MQRLAALPPVVRQQVEPQLVEPQQEPARPVLVPLAPVQRVPVWARVRWVQAPQQVLVLARPAQVFSGRVLAELPPPELAQQPRTPRWPHMALAPRRAWVAAFWALVAPQRRVR